MKEDNSKCIMDQTGISLFIPNSLFVLEKSIQESVWVQMPMACWTRCFLCSTLFSFMWKSWVTKGMFKEQWLKDLEPSWWSKKQNPSSALPRKVEEGCWWEIHQLYLGERRSCSGRISKQTWCVISLFKTWWHILYAFLAKRKMKNWRPLI